MEEKGIVDRDCLPPEPQRTTAPIAGNNPFLLHVAVHVLQGVKAKVAFPQFLLNHGLDNPTASFLVEIPETSENPTCYAP